MNRRKNKQDNVSVEFVDDEYGKTWGHFLASADDYGLTTCGWCWSSSPFPGTLPVDLLILSGKQIPVGRAPIGRSAAESIRDQYELVLRYNCTDLL